MGALSHRKIASGDDLVGVLTPVPPWLRGEPHRPITLNGSVRAEARPKWLGCFPIQVPPA